MGPSYSGTGDLVCGGEVTVPHTEGKTYVKTWPLP